MVQNLSITLPSLSVQSMDYTASASPDSDGADDILINTYSQIPLTALSRSTREQLSRLLNFTKILRSEEGYERDWRGVATLALQKTLCDENAMSIDDPMAKVIQLWCKNNPKTATFEYLERFLGIIDRWDVSDDIYENLAEDAKNYTKNLQQKSLISKALTEQQPKTNETNDDFGRGTDSNILTKDDVLRAQKGLPPQKYDAFVLFADVDINYAVEMLTKLEDDPGNNFKLCLKDRDLLAGVSFAHVALIQLIEERCKHLIVILTQSFLKSPENKFLVDYTQALQIEHKTRKIIPLIYEDTVVIPGSLKIYTHLKYNANTYGLFNFWTKLAASIRNVNIAIETPPPIYTRDNYVKTTQSAAIQPINSNTSPPDIPQISVNGNPLTDDYDDIPKKKERTLFKKRSSLRISNDNKLLAGESDDSKLMRSAHSCNQLNSTIFYDSNLPQMSGLSISSCSGAEKKKKKWPSKLFKKVFSRSTNRLQMA